MESIVLHSDIARLVLGYLVNNNLKRAALTLCRTSPHLHQEFVAFRQGLQPHNFLNGGLEEMIREHVKITGLVSNVVHKLPVERRLRMQQLKLSERLSELLKLDKTTSMNARDSTCPRTASNRTERKRQRIRALSDEEPPVSCKRSRLLAPHLYCSIERSTTSRNLSDDNDSLETSTGSDMSADQTDDGLSFHGRGPKNNSTPRAANSNEADLIMPMPQAMPELTKAIMVNEDFQQKLLNNINVALQSMTVHAPSVDSINTEAVLDDLVKNILEATEKDPSFDRVLQEVVGMEAPQGDAQDAEGTEANASTSAGGGAVGNVVTPTPGPPQTPLIIRTAVASANASNNGGGGREEVNGVNENGNGNAVIQLNGNSSIGTLIDPNFSISKLIVLNSNESAQKQPPTTTPAAGASTSVNLSFATTENLINFGDAADAIGIGNQVCVDATNGQLTFPMYLSNEGLLSHLPFLVNNEWLAQQLRSDVFANGDVSHIEIPLPEPITVAANQLPPNSIIINSAVKQPPEQQPQPQQQSQLVQLVEEPAIKPSVVPVVPASLDSSRLVLERVTPSTSGIVNVKAFRSLSTPRKRTSHVRTLNFSPKAVTQQQLQSTPVSTRRAQQQQQQQLVQERQQRRVKLKALREKQAEQQLEKPGEKQPDKPIILKNVEILPNFGSSPSTATTESEEVIEETGGTAARRDGAAPADGGAIVAGGNADLSANESNSCVPPLFAMEEGSNQTVIKAVAASKSTALATASKSTASVVVAAGTPKRKQKRNAAAKACKRIISQAVDENNVELPKESQPDTDPSASATSHDESKENQIGTAGTLTEPPQEEEEEDLMAAWQREMNASSTDLEQRLREINAKRLETQKGQPRVRRKKKASGTPLAPKQRKLKAPLSAKKMSKKKKMEKTGHGEGEFNIKITTPQKPKRSVVAQLGKQQKKELKAEEAQLQEEQQKPTEEQLQREVKQLQQHQEGLPQKPEQEAQEEQLPKEQTVKDLPAPLKTEPSKSSAEIQGVSSMSVLLQTPYKVLLMEPEPDAELDADQVPPTPGPSGLMLPLATPYAKLLPSASFLFGSDTKSILDTPMLTAITPGMRLGTPFGHGLGTPGLGSAAKTDYSSGSSYYRPDEAEHTDTNAQCALQPADAVQQTTKLSNLELHAERLPVEPMVLRRVRSFGTEAVDSAVNGDEVVEVAHYKLVSGLPDAVVENSSSSSCASSSSCSSSSSSSSSSDSSSSSSSASNSSADGACAAGQSNSSQMAHTVLVVPPAKTMQLLDMENLSDISSTEDEEWLKADAATAPPLAIDNEPAQLVSQDGEVRYPLRNWLTPSKDASAAAAAAANTSGEMAPPAAPPALPASVPARPALLLTPPPPPTDTHAPTVAPAETSLSAAEEQHNQQLLMEQRRQDLEKVRERVKAKVKQQSVPQPRPRKTAKKLTTMRETANKANPNLHGHKSPKKEAKPPETVAAAGESAGAAGETGKAKAKTAAKVTKEETASGTATGDATSGGGAKAKAAAKVGKVAGGVGVKARIGGAGEASRGTAQTGAAAGESTGEKVRITEGGKAKAASKTGKGEGEPTGGTGGAAGRKAKAGIRTETGHGEAAGEAGAKDKAATKAEKAAGAANGLNKRATAGGGAVTEADTVEVTTGDGAAAPIDTIKPKVTASEPTVSNDLDPALLMALNLSAKKQQQQQPKTMRVALEIEAQPAPTTMSTGGQRRGRPKKSASTEPERIRMRRSSRLIETKSIPVSASASVPAPVPEEDSSAVKSALSQAKVTKKPAKKRAEARLETATPSLATLAEAQTTQKSPESLRAEPASSVANGDYELDMCCSDSHVANTYCFAYADSGSKPAQPVPRQTIGYFENFQMRMMVDSGEMHSIRITSPQLLYQSARAGGGEGKDAGNAGNSIRNIPKKRKPVAASTPLIRSAECCEERDENDAEVAAINTPIKVNAGEDQAMEPHDAGVQIEDIESILSHLHGT